MKVSVSLRSIIHSYKLANFLKVCYHCKFPSPYGVSFILMFVDKVDDAVGNFISFRLLTEYHSFLLKKSRVTIGNKAILEFPSPYGVSFILIQ